jgi:Domain of unknown function (DUF1854).
MSTGTANEPKEAPATLVEASRLAFLDPKKLRFHKHGAILRLTVEDDRSFLKVGILRAFPLSDRNRFFSVRDGAENEIGIIVNPTDLSAENQNLIDEDLQRRYFVPSVKKIVSAKERFGTVEWTVETDRGVCHFTTQNLRENVQRPAAGRIILNDVDGNRYDIRNLDELSRESQEILFRHL